MRSLLNLLAGWLLGALLVSCADTTGEHPRDPGAALLSAAEQGDLPGLERLIGDNPTPDARDACQWTPLMKAATNGHFEVTRRLLEAGAQTELGDKGGYTALMLAASNNHADVVGLLLEFGADPNHIETTRGWSALIWAAKRGHKESALILLTNGANPELRDFEGFSALDWARKNQKTELVTMLSEPTRDKGRQGQSVID